MNGYLWKVFSYELRRNARRKGFLFTTFGVPLIAFVLFFGYRAITDLNARRAAENPPTQEEENPFERIGKAGYVDQTGLFGDPGELGSVLTLYADEAAAEEALNARTIDLYYLIPTDYLETGDVVLVQPRFALAQADTAMIQQLILNHLAADVDQDLFSRLVNPLNLREINLQRDASGQTESNFDTDFGVVYIFAIVLMMGVFTTNGYLMQTVIEEKETRLIEILVSTMRPTYLLAGKILALGILGAVQIAAWVGAMLLLSRLAVGDTALAVIANFSLEPGQIAVLALYFVLGYLFFAAAYGMVGAISTSLQEGPQYAVIFTLPAVVPLYFIALFTTTPDSPLVVFFSIFPITAPLAMVMRITITTVPFWQIVLSAVLLLLTDIVLIWLAGRMFRVQTLLAGQTPKLRDIPRLLRG
jgi:ABC-2 type transport system permease protein